MPSRQACYQRFCCRVLGLCLLVSPLWAQTPAPQEADPWEGFNRAMYRFNDTLDRYAVKPVAQGYRWLVPDPVETGVYNMFRNLQEIRNLLNQLLQGKPVLAASDGGRFLLNSTLGLAGFFDVASAVGLERHDEDFGQTLGVWGVPPGPYFVMPLFGPSTVRDAGGWVLDVQMHPVQQVDHVPTRNTLTTLDFTGRRAELLKVEDVVFGDRYEFLRDAYLQHRHAQVHDGNVADDFGSSLEDTF